MLLWNPLVLAIVKLGEFQLWSNVLRLRLGFNSFSVVCVVHCCVVFTIYEFRDLYTQVLHAGGLQARHTSTREQN